MKNLKLKLELPSVIVGGKEFKLPKGTVLQWNEEYSCYGVFDHEEDDIKPMIREEDVSNNPSFFSLSIAKPTYPVFVIDDNQVKFNYGYITIGCQEIENDMVREIFKNLKGGSGVPKKEFEPCIVPNLSPSPYGAC